MSQRMLLRMMVVGVVVQLPGAVVTSSSAALTLTTPTVSTPTVPLKTPTVPVRTPTVQVTTPTVTVKSPTPPPVTVPSVPAKPPPGPAPPPVLPVKTAPKATPVPVKIPVPLKPPAVSTPSVEVASSPSLPGTGRVSVPALSVPSASGSPAATRISRVGATPGAVGSAATSGDGLLSDGPAAGALSGFAGFLQGGQGLPSSDGAAPTMLGAERALRLLARGRITLADPRVRNLVRGLVACLPLLPARMRTVLRLRTGVGDRHPFSARAVARKLHVSRRRLAILEVRSLRRLVTAARTSGCSRPALAPASRFVSVAYLSIVGPGSLVPAGGVAGGLYLKAPAGPGPESVPPAEAIPGSALPVRPASSGRLVWEAGLAALLGVLLVAYLVRDEMGLGSLRARRGRRRSRGGRSRGGDGGR